MLFRGEDDGSSRTLAGEGKVFEKGVVGRPERFFRIYEPFSRKDLVIKPFHHQLTKRSDRYEKEKYVIRCFVLLMLIATFVACASTSKQEGTGEYVDDSVITTKVKSLLAVR